MSDLGEELRRRRKVQARQRVLYMIERFAEAGMPNCRSIIDDERIIFHDLEKNYHIKGVMPIDPKDDEGFIQRFIAKFREDIDE